MAKHTEHEPHPLLVRLVDLLDRLEVRLGSFHQVEEAEKVPDYFVTQPISIPDSTGATTVQLSGGMKRKTVTIQNVGANDVKIGSSFRETSQIGFTLAKGSSPITISTKGPIFAYCASTSTVEILETRFGKPGRL